MSSTDTLSPTKQLIARRRAAARRRRILFVLLVVSWVAGLRIKRELEQRRVFVVQVVRLATCPDHLRGQVAQVLSPLVGKTVLEANAQAPKLRERLSRLPEVADASIACRPPNLVEVRVKPRVPTLAVQVPSGWLSVDATGVIVRVVPKPERGLPQVYGLHPAVVTPGSQVAPTELAAATAAVQASVHLLGKPPRALTFVPGGGIRLRTIGGDLVMLGQPRDLERKLYVYTVVRNRLTEPAQYIDVASPTTPVWLPVPPPPPAPAATSPTTPAKPPAPPKTAPARQLGPADGEPGRPIPTTRAVPADEPRPAAIRATVAKPAAKPKTPPASGGVASGAARHHTSGGGAAAGKDAQAATPKDTAAGR